MCLTFLNERKQEELGATDNRRIAGGSGCFWKVSSQEVLGAARSTWTPSGRAVTSEVSCKNFQDDQRSRYYHIV